MGIQFQLKKKKITKVTAWFLATPVGNYFSEPTLKNSYGEDFQSNFMHFLKILPEDGWEVVSKAKKFYGFYSVSMRNQSSCKPIYV